MIGKASTTWYSLARSRVEVGDSESALACDRRAMALDPHNPQILTSCGTVLYKLRRRNEGIGMYREALSHHPEHEGARASLEFALASKFGDISRPRQLREEAERLHRAGNLTKALDLHFEAFHVAPRVGHHQSYTSDPRGRSSRAAIRLLRSRCVVALSIGGRP